MNLNLSFIQKAIPKGEGKYDILVPISGGKDGAFILWWLSKYTDYKILAFHYDNWYISEETRRNITQIMKVASCDLICLKDNWLFMKELYSKALTNMGEICIICEMFLNINVMQYALINNISCIAWGLTKSQLANKNIEHILIKSDKDYYSNILQFYQTICESLYADDSDILGKLEEVLFKNSQDHLLYPYIAYPFGNVEYNAEEIEEIIMKEMGWIRPSDTGGISSNCSINKLHIYLKKHIKGNDYYENALNRKVEHQELAKQQKDRAVNSSITQRDIQFFLEDLSINLSTEDLIDKIKNYRKNAFLRSQSNISL